MVCCPSPAYHRVIMTRPSTSAQVAAKTANPVVVGSVSTIAHPHRPSKDVPEPSHLNDHFGRARPQAGPFPWTLGFGLLSVALLIAAGVLWSQVNDRNRIIHGDRIRAQQMAAKAIMTQAQLTEAQTVTLRLLKQLDATTAEIIQLKASGNLSKAESAGLRADLTKALTTSLALQRENDQAKLTAPARPTAVEVARASEIERRRSLQKTD